MEGRVTGEPHDIDGSHYSQCSEHLAQHTRWRKARDVYVGRQKAKAEAAGEHFDKAAALRAREQDTPWRPDLLSDRARGVLPILPPEVKRLRTTVAELLDAKLPVDTAHREGEGLTRKQLNRLLTAIERHAALVNSLLKDVRR